MDAPKWHTTRYPGVYIRHRKGCAAPDGRCRCTPSYRVRYRPEGEKPKWSKVFHDLSEARAFQTSSHETPAEVVTPEVGPTLTVMHARWMREARAGRIATRAREPYAGRTLDIYQAAYANHVAPTYGPREAASLSALDWQLLVDDLARHGLSHNTLQTVLNSVRVVYRWACAPTRRLLLTNELHGVEMPAKDEVRRDRIAPPEEAQALLAALTMPCDVLDFALALYAGLRNKERWGLDWTDIEMDYDEHGFERSPSQVAAGENPHSGATDISQGRELPLERGAKNGAPVRARSVRARADRRGTIHIRREITKSKAGVRTLPVIGQLRPILLREWMRQGRPLSGKVLVYPGATAHVARLTFAKAEEIRAHYAAGSGYRVLSREYGVGISAIRDVVLRRTWREEPKGGTGRNAYQSQARRVAKDWERAGLKRITPHEARHTFASYLIASGLNAKAVTVLMGHASIVTTFDRYGKLFRGHEDEAATMLDAYLGVPETEMVTA